MLILSRGPQESVRIGDSIEVVVISTRGNQVRLGIKAPDGVVILREELTRTEPASPPQSETAP